MRTAAGLAPRSTAGRGGCGRWRETRKGVKMAEPSPEWEGRKRMPEMERWVRD